MTPCQECHKKLNFRLQRRLSVHGFWSIYFSINCAWVMMSELSWLHRLVKHNVAAKHKSSKPLTSNELWLLELRIKSTRILASIPDALWDMWKSSIQNASVGCIVSTQPPKTCCNSKMAAAYTEPTEQPNQGKYFYEHTLKIDAVGNDCFYLFGSVKQNVKTKSPNGPWKCWHISIPDV